MKIGFIKKGTERRLAHTCESAIYPNIDSTYTVREYSGNRIRINTNPMKVGVKAWATMPANMQGMAIYGNILVRMVNTGSYSTHYIYRITEAGNLTQLTTFTMPSAGHSNALQFAPTVEAGEEYPFLYVSEINGSCVVLRMTAGFSMTQVQKITAPGASNLCIGDDGYLWGFNRPGGHLRFIRFRKVAVSEGANVALTEADILEDWLSDEIFTAADYTSQGQKVKFGKIWLPFGTTGDTQRRCLIVYDLTARRMHALVDLTDLANFEPEDVDFWDDALIMATYSANNYILRF